MNIPETLGFLESTLREVSQAIRPDREFNFNYHFVDEDFRGKYGEEEKVRKIYIIFGCLAVFIACLGLFGLASFTVEQRTKETGAMIHLATEDWDRGPVITYYSFPLTGPAFDPLWEQVYDRSVEDLKEAYSEDLPLF